MGGFRLLAGILAIGGIFWGMFALYFILFGDTVYSLLVFGAGYLVTIGYIWRASITPKLEYRLLIWGLSMIIQGVWLAWGIVALLHDGVRNVCFDGVIEGWWMFAFFTSIYAFLRDRECQENKGQENKGDATH